MSILKRTLKNALVAVSHSRRAPEIPLLLQGWIWCGAPSGRSRRLRPVPADGSPSMIRVKRPTDPSASGGCMALVNVIARSASADRCD